MHSLIRLSFYIFPLKALWFYCGCVCGVCANPPAVCTLYFSSIKTNLISPAPTSQRIASPFTNSLKGIKFSTCR